MSNTELQCVTTKIVSPKSSSGSDKQEIQLSEALKKVIKKTEVDVEKEFQTHYSLSTLSMDSINPEIIRLKHEINRRITECERKERLLSRLKEQAAYPMEGNAYSPDDLTDTNLLAPVQSLQPTISRLKSSLDQVLLKTVEEDQTTEMLRNMHEKATHSKMIMKQRTREVQTVLERVSHQLVQASAMRHIADNFLTMAHGETHFVKEEMNAGKERFNDRYFRKIKDRDVLAGRRRKTIERISVARYRQTEVVKQKQGIIKTLDAELQRHTEEKSKLTKANRDIAVFATGLRTIADVLQAHGCYLHHDFGLSPEAISTIVSQYNALFVLEGSLASRYSQLTWDYREREETLQSLRGHLARLQQFPDDTDESDSRPTGPGINTEVADKADRLSLKIHSDMISLLSHLEAVHERVTGQLPYPESPAGIDWMAIKTLTSGVKEKPIERIASTDSLDVRRRSGARSNTMQPLRSRFSVIEEKWNEDETWARVNGLRMTSSDIKRMLKDAKLHLFEHELDTFFRHTLVVKCFADVPSIREFLKAAKLNSELRLESLLTRCHSSFRGEFRSVVSFNREVLQSFRHSQVAMQIDPQQKTSNADSIDPYIGKRQKEVVRLRLSMLSHNQEDSSQPTSSSKRVFTSETRRPKQEDEAVETQHIAELRSQMKCAQPASQPCIRRSESALAVTRTRKLHEMQDPLRTERAKILLKGFLSTERKISAVKDKERSTFKSQSLRGSPYPVRFSLGHTRVNTAPAIEKKPFRRAHSRGGSAQFFATTMQY